MKPAILVALALTVACHARHDPYGRVLERGGELANVPMQAKNVIVSADAITAWGVLEVPDGSRMQATYAGVDAIVRSEILKVIEVRIADVMVSVDSTDPARRQAYEHTIEEVRGALRHAGIPRHGWERVQHPDRIILRVWAQLTVARADLGQLPVKAWWPGPADETSDPRAR